jgi:hypothetical protein
MADRDKDIAFLNKLAKGRATPVIILLVLAALMWIVVTVGSILDVGRKTTVPTSGPHPSSPVRDNPQNFPITPTLLICAFMISLSPLWMAHNYFVISPLVREIQRLRAEIEALRSEKRGAEPGTPGDRGGI